MTKRKRATKKPKTNGVISDTILTADCKPHKSNYNKHSDAQIEDLRESLRQFGPVRSIVVQKKKRGKGYTLVAGEGVWIAAWAEEIPELPARIIPAKWSATKVKAYLAADNELGRYATADEMQLAALVQQVHDTEGETLARLAAGEKNALDRLLAMTNGSGAPEDAGARITEAERLQEIWGVKSGDLWQLGDHRLVCGDCTDPAVVERVMGEDGVDAMLTDPPYCSGGFQESGKASGSVGTRGTEMIVRDTLSTRGYIALMRRTLDLCGAGVVYIFTDWRMWINLFDVVEEKGFGVRNMIVWDKGSPGMGAGWRMQHELIMCGIRVKSPFNPKKAQGNVIQASRTGNKNHATEKPIDLLETIISVNDLANIYFDPFCGSGSTVIAVERSGKQCRAIEISEAYCAVALQRFLDTTSVQPERIDA